MSNDDEIHDALAEFEWRILFMINNDKVANEWSNFSSQVSETDLIRFIFNDIGGGRMT